VSAVKAGPGDREDECERAVSRALWSL